MHTLAFGVGSSAGLPGRRVAHGPAVPQARPEREMALERERSEVPAHPARPPPCARPSTPSACGIWRNA